MATVLISDLSACKAYVQVIDTVLIPTAVSVSMILLPCVCLSIHLSSACLYVISVGDLSPSISCSCTQEFCSFSCCLQAAKTFGMVSVDVPGAGETDTQTVQSLVSKKSSTATPAATVPVETILVPATPVAPVPPVAVSGMGYIHLVYALLLLLLLLLLKCKPAVHMLFGAASPLRFAQMFSVCKHRMKMKQLQSMQMLDVSSCTCGCYLSCYCCCSEL